MQHPARSPPTHSDTSQTAASRFFVSMRNPFSPPASPRKKSAENTRVAMYSTPEERHAHNNSSRASRSHYLDARPTIEQIAMGLHVSRTPHLRPTHGPLQRYPIPTLNPTLTLGPKRPTSLSSTDLPDDPSPSPYRTRYSLPPPPPRSSMKKTSQSASTLTQPPRQSLSTPPASVVAPAAPTSTSPRPLSSLRARVSKFIPGYRPSSLPFLFGRPSSITSSASDSTRPATPRKAVRFSTSVLGIDEHS